MIISAVIAGQIISGRKFEVAARGISIQNEKYGLIDIGNTL